MNKEKRDYNREFKDNEGRKYGYSFDYDVMHKYMVRAFEPFFNGSKALELGSFKGDFTWRLFPYFKDITCVEASDEALSSAKDKYSDKSITYIENTFEDLELTEKYDAIFLMHTLEHLDNPVLVLEKIKGWLSPNGKLYLVVPNANAPSRQIAVKMGLITHNSAVTPAEQAHGHRITYTLDTLERDVKASGLSVFYRTGIFFKALANFQWDRLLETDIVSEAYLDGCYALGQQYPDLCSSIFILCGNKGESF